MRLLIAWLALVTLCALLVVFLPNGGGAHPEESSRESIIRRGQLYQDENRSADPCTEPFNRVCGGYIVRGDESGHRGTLSDLNTWNDNRLTWPYVTYQTATWDPQLDVYWTEGGRYEAFVTVDGSAEDTVPSLSANLSCLSHDIQLWANSTDFVNIDTRLLPPCVEMTYELSPRAAATRFCANNLTAAFLPLVDLTGVEKLIIFVRDAFVEHLNTLPVSTQIKREFIKRIRGLRWHFGGGASWPDCSMCASQEIDVAYCQYERFETMRPLIGTSSRIFHWEMVASDANAYFQDNAIYFPAGICQPPLYHPDYDFQLNLGGLGSIIAHEMGHSLDLHGAVNHVGHVGMASLEEYSGCIQTLFQDLGQSDDRFNITENENLADAWSAAVLGPKFTELGWEAFGQVWCKIHASQSVPGDPHSAAKYRVNAAMLNSQSYLDMFDCPASAKCRVHG